MAKKILLVEDEAIIALYEAKTITKHGFEVVKAHSGEDAVEKADSDIEISLILMDIDLGEGIDGTEAARRILQNREIPIVFLTGHAEEEYVQRVKRITNYGYVLKNAGEFVLMEAINMAFNLFEANQGLKRENVTRREAEEELSSIYEHTPVLILLVDEERRIRKANAFISRFAGSPAQEMIGDRVGEVFRCIHHLDDPEGCGFGPFCSQCTIRRIIAEAFEIKKAYRQEEAVLPVEQHGENQELTFLVSTTIINKEQKHLCLITFEDITERKKMEETLRESEQRFKQIWDHMAVGVALVSLDFHIKSANDAYCHILGYSEEELRGTHIKDITHPETLKENLEKQERLARGEIDHYRMEKTFIHNDGHTVYGLLDANLLRDEEGTPLYFIGSVVDTTEQKQVEEKFRTLMNQTIDMLFLHDLDGNIVDVNQPGVQLTGYGREELLSMRIPDLDPDYYEREDRGNFWRQLDFNTPYRFEARLIRKDGATFPVEVALAKVIIDGKAYIMTLSRDITERKKNEASIEHERVFLSTVLESIEAAIVICDQNGHISRFNEAARKLHKLPAIPIPYEEWTEHYNLYKADGVTPFPSEEIPLLRALRGEVVHNVEIVVAPKNSKPHSVLCNARQLTDTAGRVLGAVVAMHDVSEYKEIEASLRNAMREKDYLMQEINHRVKNNLAMVSSLIALKDGEIEEDLSDLRAQIRAIQKVHEQLNNTSVVSEIDFAEYIGDMLETIFSTYFHREVGVEVETNNIHILSKTAVPLGLIVNELATNAIKHGFSEEKEALFTLDLREDTPKQQYLMRVSNSGRPFPEEVDLDHPHTLGLQLVSTLVHQIGGSIELVKSPSPVYTIRFPKTQ